MLEKISNQFNCVQDVTSFTSFAGVMILLFQYLIVALETDQLLFQQEPPRHVKLTLHWEHHTCFQVCIPENWIPHEHLGIHFLLLLVHVILLLQKYMPWKWWNAVDTKYIWKYLFLWGNAQVPCWLYTTA